MPACESKFVTRTMCSKCADGIINVTSFGMKIGTQVHTYVFQAKRKSVK